MKNKLLFISVLLLFALIFASCTPEAAEKLVEGVAAADPSTAPNAHAQYFEIDENGAVSLKDKTIVPVSLIIPQKVDEKEVKSVKDCKESTFTSVRIPGNVKTIEDNAFFGCTSLTSVIIDSGVESIGEDAFVGCTALEMVQIYSSGISIDRDAFPDREMECWYLGTEYDSIDDIREYIKNH